MDVWHGILIGILLTIGILLGGRWVVAQIKR